MKLGNPVETTAAYFRRFGTPPRLARKLRSAGNAALLVDQLIAELRRRGISKREVAEAIGIAPVTLSRAFQKHLMELSTFLLLVEAAGFEIEMKSKATPVTEEANTILGKLREHEDALRQAGIESIAIFGSVANGTAQESSDIDLLISTRVPVSEYGKIDMAIGQALSGVLAHQPRPIDVAIREKLKPEISAKIKREAIYAF